jgi:hypothetical protein
MEALLDLLPAIIAYLIYKGFQARKEWAKRTQIPQRPVLTPVHGGGFPSPQSGTSMAVKRVEQRDSIVKEADDKPVSEMTAPRENGAESHASSPYAVLAYDEAAENMAIHADAAREGMKWAIIFSPPRSKMPHRFPK